MGFPREMVRVTVDPSGRVITDVGTQNHGQGHETSFAQVVAEYLGVPFEKVDIVNGDSDRLPDGGGTHSNRSMRIAGTLMVQGCETLIDRGRAFSFVIQEDTGFASIAVAREEMTVSVFGACTPRN